jgi:hypothetical protein
MQVMIVSSLFLKTETQMHVYKFVLVNKKRNPQTKKNKKPGELFFVLGLVMSESQM